MVTLEIPFPPSINHYFSYQHGRPILSKNARAFRQQVRRLVIANGFRPLLGPLAIRLDLHPPDDRRRDCDNSQKSILDALQHAGVFWDDSQVVWLLTLVASPQSFGSVLVHIDEFKNFKNLLEQECP